MLYWFVKTNAVTLYITNEFSIWIDYAFKCDILNLNDIVNDILCDKLHDTCVLFDILHNMLYDKLHDILHNILYYTLNYLLKICKFYTYAIRAIFCMPRQPLGAYKAGKIWIFII